MGNCCKVVKKPSEKPITVVKPKEKESNESGTVTTEDRSQRKKTLTILCTSPEFTTTLRYRPAIPLQELKDQIISACPNLDALKFSLFRDDLEILDPTATVQQLGIVPGDTLEVRIKEDSVDYSEDIIASENNSIAEPNEEVKKGEVHGVTAKKGLAARNVGESGMTSPKKPAKELWRTALPSPPARTLINVDPLDASSMTNNTHDRSLKAPQAAFQVKIPPMMESDDSNLDDKRAKNRENSAYFQDLKGPFYMFQKDS